MHELMDLTLAELSLAYFGLEQVPSDEHHLPITHSIHQTHTDCCVPACHRCRRLPPSAGVRRHTRQSATAGIQPDVHRALQDALQDDLRICVLFHSAGLFPLPFSRLIFQSLGPALVNVFEWVLHICMLLYSSYLRSVAVFALPVVCSVQSS
jgi:hypothetical protein